MGRERGRAPPGRTHGSATTTPRVRRAIQESEEKNTVLAKRYNVSRNTIAKWKARESTSDERMGPKNPCSSVLTQNGEAIVLAYRWRTRLSLDDCLERLRRVMPQLSRSALHRCFERHGLGKIGRTDPRPPLTSDGPHRFEITANEVVFPNDILGEVVEVFLAVEEVSKYVYAEVAQATPENAAAFLAHLLAEFPQMIDAIATDIRPIFVDWRATFDEDMAAVGPHPFAVACRANRIVHTRTPLPFQIPLKPKKRSRAVEIR